MWINRILWIIYIALLAVLLPHTAWAFKQFEPEGWAWVGWVAAFAFEAAIAAFTWRLKQLIETTPNYRKRAWFKRLRYRYLSPYGLGLFAALIISAVANWAHAVEFGQSFAVFARYSVPTWAFSVGFGAILPLISLLFARVLAEAQDTEEETNQDLLEAKQTIKELRKELKATEEARNDAEQRIRIVEQEAEADRRAAEHRFDAISDLVTRLFAEEKRQRILAAREQWPQLPAASIAIIAESSPSYVSEVLADSKEETIIISGEIKP
jgi:hypothetical protein